MCKHTKERERAVNKSGSVDKGEKFIFATRITHTKDEKWKCK
jgi:hypothetical protein